MKLLPFLNALSLVVAVAGTQGCGLSYTENMAVTNHYAPTSKNVRLIEITSDRIDDNKFSARRVAEKDYRNGIKSFASSTNSVDVGMGNVPVLDQGQYGTCVTFASTAALDARLGRGDFISQQCSLALDKRMGSDWWDGAYYPSQIIDPIQSYGVVEKFRCPSSYPDRDQSLDPQTYQNLADTEASAEVKKVKYVYSKSDLNGMKAALKAGHRVVFAFLINASGQEAVQGFNIKVDGSTYQGGLWACKQGSSPNYCVKSNAGHEVVAIGYDDKQQLLKIRNSWSAQVGDNGDYYMSYAFFNTMSVDMTVVY